MAATVIPSEARNLLFVCREEKADPSANNAFGMTAQDTRQEKADPSANNAFGMTAPYVCR